MTVPQTSRGPLASVAGAALAGVASAALLAVALRHPETLGIFLAYLTVLPLFIAGLGAGGLAALIASVTGTTGLYLTGPSNFAFIYAFIFAVPAIVLTALALRFRGEENTTGRWYPEGNLLAALAIYPCLIFTLLSVLLHGYPGGLLTLTTSAFSEIADKLAAQMPGPDAVVLHNALDRAAQIAPALVGTTWTFVFLICMGMAQVVLQRQGWNLRPRFELAGLQVPGWLIYLVALTGLAGAFAPVPFGYIGVNLSLMLGMPFFFVGLAVIHSWAATTRMPMLALTAFYILVSVLIWLVLLVALIGILDQWLDFRRRFKPSKPTPGI